MTDQPTTTAPETTCLGCPGCGGPDCIQRTTEPPDPDQEPQMLVPCGLAVLNWPDHSPHSWQIQPDMDPVRCEGATPSLYARERAAHEEHRRQLADALRVNPGRLRDWDETIKAARDIAKLREDNQLRAEKVEAEATRLSLMVDEYSRGAQQLSDKLRDAKAKLARVRDVADRWDRDAPPPGNRPLSELRDALGDDQPAETTCLPISMDFARTLHTALGRALGEQP